MGGGPVADRQTIEIGCVPLGDSGAVSLSYRQHRFVPHRMKQARACIRTIRHGNALRIRSVGVAKAGADIGNIRIRQHIQGRNA